ncbi:MAG: alpha/beta fold hydrolase [Gemmobacter sp.]|nr:alpha/beta fold hydrolase [Gemmobacter sp.]
MIWPEAAGVGTLRTVFVGTSRGYDTETGHYTRERTHESFARFDISIPPDRELGNITWPRKNSKPDPQRQFLTVKADRYETAAAFRTDLSTAMRPSRKGAREAVIFVHGFNNTFSEGMYRIAQLSNDLSLPGVAVHYSWPSRASALGYVYDRDSALFARDGLERLVTEVAAAGADRILIVAHSMGSSLTMEALRQIAIRGRTNVMNKMAGVILISPDLDIDVFRAQAEEIGKLPQPFIIFTSARDRALALSAVVSGETNRLGNLRDVGALAGLDVTLLEVGAYSTGAGHFTAATSPALLQLLGGVAQIDAAFDFDRVSRVGLLPGAVLTVQGATRIILSPVTAIVDAAQ